MTAQRTATDLTGRTVLLTGASKGIGAAAARAIGAAGAHLVAHYGRDAAGARAATADIPPERVLLLGADLGSPAEARRLWREAVAWRGRVDTLICNAAIMEETPLESDDAEWDATWQRTFEVNVYAPASLVRDAVRHHREHGGGVVVTLSSWAAQQGSGNPHLLAYASSKAALHTLTRTVARAHAREGVLAYVVAPGIVRTDMSVRSAATTGGEEAVTARLAMREWVPPEEAGALIAWLASGSVRHLTGATLDLNGASYPR